MAVRIQPKRCHATGLDRVDHLFGSVSPNQRDAMQVDGGLGRVDHLFGAALPYATGSRRQRAGPLRWGLPAASSPSPKGSLPPSERYLRSAFVLIMTTGSGYIGPSYKTPGLMRLKRSSGGETLVLIMKSHHATNSALSTWSPARLSFCWYSPIVSIETPTEGRAGCSRMSRRRLCPPRSCRRRSPRTSPRTPGRDIQVTSAHAQQQG